MNTILSVQIQKLIRRRKRVYESFSNRRISQSHLFRQFPGIWQNLVKNYHGLIQCTSTSHRSETDGIVERTMCAELKKELLLCCSNLAWTTSGRRIPWNVSGQMARHFRSGDVENILFGSMTESHHAFAKDQQILHQFGKTI